MIFFLSITSTGQALPLSSANVTGIEFSDNLDRDAAGAADPEQNINTDGAGTATDGLDFSGSRVVDMSDRQIDALANNGDAYFHNMKDNTVDMLFSVSGNDKVYFEETNGGSGLWASSSEFNGTQAITDIDGLEVWGPTFPQSDAWRYSVALDAAENLAGDLVSVWEYDSSTGISNPLHTLAGIGNAIGIDPGLLGFLDVDAMMTFQDEILFSIAPIAGFYDGGEIWLWDSSVVGNTASYLFHGGHEWNTAFDVAGTFGLNSENINALEAAPIPEQDTLKLMGTGLIALVFFMIRRQRNKLQISRG